VNFTAEFPGFMATMPPLKWLKKLPAHGQHLSRLCRRASRPPKSEIRGWKHFWEASWGTSARNAHSLGMKVAAEAALWSGRPSPRTLFSPARPKLRVVRALPALPGALCATRSRDPSIRLRIDVELEKMPERSRLACNSSPAAREIYPAAYVRRQLRC